MQKGNISVQTENIFPIIKQFLYSDQEIFLRELVSNAVDATSKLRTLAKRGETGEIGDTTINILLDNDAKTLTIRDQGIGMTEEEVQKYLNQVAFSSAAEFLEKYKDESSIIGHFGLGFYSAFMVADHVEVLTKSYKEGAEPVKWSCEGNPEYTIEAAEKEARGTDIVLHISEDSTEFLEESRVSELLNKYCKFLPVEIQFGMRTDVSYEAPEEEGGESKKIETEVPNIINNPNPAWKKQPSELTDEDYRAFYTELHPMGQPPLFWIHLNIDYPFNLTGILYFPKVNASIAEQRDKIQLYSNQVYVTDDVKEIVPEFLTLLHGVIDSPDIPLNVSRSYLQSDSNVRKITGYITKKVAEKLNDLYKKDRAAFEEKWPDLSVFVKYGMISDEKFYDRAEKFALLKNIEGSYFTTAEYKEKVKEAQTDKHDKTILLYTNDTAAHDSYISAAKGRGYDVLEFDHIIDNHFVQHLEQKAGDVTFVRVDSDTVDMLIQKDETTESVLSEQEQEDVKTTFEGLIEAQTGASIILKPLTPEDAPVQITKPEFMRRFQEMQALQGQQMPGMFNAYNVVVNSNHPLVAQKLLQLEGEERKDLSKYLYDLAMLNQGMLKGKELTAFVQKSLKFVQ
ncbi:MAG: molecular chaperone HtpG [Bacteroidota bacterium]